MKFRTKTILGIGLIEAILLVLLVFSSFDFLQRSNDEQIIERAKSTVSLFTATTKDAVISTDLDSLQNFVSELLTNKGVVYVRILSQGSVLAQGGDADLLRIPFVEDTSLKSVTDNIFDISSVIQESGYTFGKIELGLSVAATKGLISDALRWVSGIAAIEILLVAIFSFILGTYLTSQLKILTKASEIIGNEGPGYQIEVKGNDEIAQLSHAFNKTSQQLAETYQQLNSSAKEYRNLAERLADSDAKKSSMLSTALDAIITIDSEGIIEEFNEAAQIIFGYSRQHAVGRLMSDLIIPDEHLSAHTKGMEHWKKTGKGPILGKRFESSAVRKSGEVFPIELAITPIEVNGATFFTGFIRDITREKQAELELRMAASTFDAQEGIFITDADSKIIRVNNAFSVISGYKQAEVIGSTPSQLFKSGRHDQTFYKELWEALSSKGRWVGEIYNRRKNGEIYPQWLGISAIRDSDQEVINFVAHFIDISQRKKFEEELVDARKKAESANIAKSQFLAAMSHEIRTPLNGVMGMTDLLMKSDLQPKQLHMLRTANHSAQILMDIIKNILDFSKIESGEMSLEELPVSLSSIIEETCEILAPVAGQKQIKLIIFIDPQINQMVLSDPVRLHQILFNLCSNAIKFTSTDAIKEGLVILRAVPVGKNQNSDRFRLRISVEDNGIGINKETLENIFEPFTQAELSTTRQYGGSGLGLAITRRIVETMNGTIDVESLPGTGTRFSVELPFQLTPELDTQPQKLTGYRILLVESYSPYDSYIIDYLKQQGAETNLANNLHRADQKSIQSKQQGKPYHVIIVGAAWSPKQQKEWVYSLKNKMPSKSLRFVLLTDIINQPDEIEDNIHYLNAFPLLPSDLIQEVVSAAQQEPVITAKAEFIEQVEPYHVDRALNTTHDVRILLAEDNEINQDVIELQLLEMGFHVDIARDGEEALEMIHLLPYDLVLTDYHMPNMDGFELAQNIRQLAEPACKVPIIAISANSLDYEEKNWSDIGVNDYLTKPLTVDVLKTTLQKYINFNKIETSREKEIFDKSVLQKLVSKAPEGVREKLLRKFVLTAGNSVKMIAEARIPSDLETVQREAHKLKSSANTIGAYRLSDTCSLLELSCKQKDTDMIQQKVEIISQQFEEVSGLLNNSILNS